MIITIIFSGSRVTSSLKGTSRACETYYHSSLRDRNESHFSSVGAHMPLYHTGYKVTSLFLPFAAILDGIVQVLFTCHSKNSTILQLLRQWNHIVVKETNL